MKDPGRRFVEDVQNGDVVLSEGFRETVRAVFHGPTRRRAVQSAKEAAKHFGPSLEKVRKTAERRTDPLRVPKMHDKTIQDTLEASVELVKFTDHIMEFLRSDDEYDKATFLRHLQRYPAIRSRLSDVLVRLKKTGGSHG